MTIAAMSAANAMSQQTVQSVGQYKHGGHRVASISDIDAQGSSVAAPPSGTGKIGSKIDIRA